MEKGKLGMVIVGMVVSVGGILIPIAWQEYKSTTALEVHMIALDKIVEVSHERIEIRYNKEPIPSMSRMTVHIVNTGRKPVRHAEPKKGQKEPELLVLKVPDNVRLLDFSVDGGTQNLRVKPTVVLGKAPPPSREPQARAEKGKSVAPVKYDVPGEVSLRLPVLYPRDYVRASLLTAGHPTLLEVAGDFDDVPRVQFIDRTKDYTGGRPKTPGSVRFVGFFSAMVLLGALVGGLPMIRRGYRARAALEGGRFGIPSMETRDAYLGYLVKELDFLPSRDLNNLKTFLNNQPGQIDEFNRKEFERMAVKAIDESKPGLGVFVGFLTAGLIGVLYVVWMLL